MKKHFQLLLFLSFCQTFPLLAQDWKWATTFSGQGEMDLIGLANDQENNTYFSGTFSESVDFQGTEHVSLGLNDNYLVKLNEAGEIQWARTGGSMGNDVDSGICTDHSGAIYWAGNFWITGTFGELELAATKSSKSIYLLKYDPNGNIIWNTLIEGSTFKNNGPPTTDAENNVYLVGSFSDSLFIDGQSITATAEEDLFVAKWDEVGNFQWVKQFGISGINRGMEVLINPDGQIIIGGIFKGQLALGSDTINANTPDFDVFLATLDPNGTGLWVRKAGGVLEDNFSSMAIDEVQNIYVTGQYTGRLSLDEAITIETEGFNENAYLIKYTQNGSPIWAKSIGGTNFETSTDLLYQNKELIVSGFFDQQIEVDEYSVLGPASLQGFLLNIEPLDNKATGLQIIHSDLLLLINKLSQTTNALPVIGGTFKGNYNLLGNTISSRTNFSVFVGTLNSPMTTSNNTIPILPKVEIFPNPASNQLKIETDESSFTFSIWSLNGQLIHKSINDNLINIKQIPTGLYITKFTDSNGQSVIEKVVINP